MKAENFYDLLEQYWTEKLKTNYENETTWFIGYEEKMHGYTILIGTAYLDDNYTKNIDVDLSDLLLFIYNR